MKTPIPDDWDGVSWSCYQIQWPDSPKWQAILAGLLSQPARGPMWDVRTGWIPDAQDIGREILGRNWPYRDCNGEKLPPTIEQFSAIGCAIELEDNLMPCFDISALLKIENGVLYAKDACCEWIEIGAIGTVSGAGDVPDDPLDAGGGSITGYYPCSKAQAITGKIYQTIAAVIQYAESNPLEWPNYIHGVEATVGYDLDNNWLLYALPIAVVAHVAGAAAGDYMDSEDQLELNYLTAALLDDSSAAFGYDVFKAIYAAWQTYYQTFYPYPYARWQMISKLLNAWGTKDLAAVALLGGADDAADCSQPALAGIINYGPDANGWYLSGPVTEGQLTDAAGGAGAVHVCFNDTPHHDVFGFAIRLDWTGTPGTVKQEDPTGIECEITHDAELTVTSSHHYEILPPGTWWIFAHDSTIRAAVAALVGNPNSGYDVTAYSADPETPGAYAGDQIMQGAITASGDAGGCSLTISEVRLLHNTNSPSHG